MRRVLAVTLLFPLAAVAEPPADTPLAPYPSVAADPLPETDRTAAAALDAKLDRPLADLPPLEGVELREFFEFVADALGAGLLIDEPTIGDATFRLNRPIPLFLPGDSPLAARTLLDLIAEPNGLAIRNRAGNLVVTSRKLASEELATRVYDIRSLRQGVAAVPQATLPTVAATCFGSTPEAETLEEASRLPPFREPNMQMILVLQQATSGPWFDIDGTGGTLTLYDDMLVVRQTETMHAEIAAILGAMPQTRAARPQTLPQRASPVEAVPPQSPERKAAAAADAKLDRVIAPLTFADLPLRDALAVIAKKIDADLVMDEQEATDEGTDLSDPVTLDVQHTPATARIVLDGLLRPLHLTVMTTGGFLRVTSVSAADETHETRVYNVRDLVRPCPCPPPPPVNVPTGGAGLFSTPDPLPAETPQAAAPATPALSSFGYGYGGVERCFDMPTLIQLIQQVTSGPWFDIDSGGGTLAPLGDRLVVGHDATIQAEIARLLSDLRAADAEPRSPTPEAAGRCPNDFDEAVRAAVKGEGGQWFDRDGSGGSLGLVDGLLVVRQSGEAQAAVAALLDGLRSSADAANAPQGGDSGPPLPGERGQG